LKPLVAPHIASLKPDLPGPPAGERGGAWQVVLANNENPLGPSPRVVRALTAAAASAHLYPDNAAQALRERLSTHHRVAADEIALGHGSNALIELSARTFATPAEHALIGWPSFSCYGVSLAAAGVETTRVPLRESLFWDATSIRAAVRPETKLLFLDNPGNPTSTHLPRNELHALLRDLPEDIVVVVDEAYAEFADDESYGTALAMRHVRERLIVLRTFSKAYGLAGVRVGYAIAARSIIVHLEAMRVPFNVSALGQAAAIAALDDREHLQATLALNARERAQMTSLLRGLGLYVAPSQTNFVLVGLPRSATGVCEALRARGVIVRMTEPPLSHHVRITVGLPEANERALNALSDTLAGLDTTA
jgi:histidinol-phosphate aminotransferase